MPKITSFDQARTTPDLSVMEFAILIALLRHGPVPAPIILPTLSDWLNTELGLSDIQPQIRRLLHNGMVTEPDGVLTPHKKSLEPVSMLYQLVIRMIGTEFSRVLSKATPSLLDEILKKDE